MKHLIFCLVFVFPIFSFADVQRTEVEPEAKKGLITIDKFVETFIEKSIAGYHDGSRVEDIQSQGPIKLDFSVQFHWRDGGFKVGDYHATVILPMALDFAIPIMEGEADPHTKDLIPEFLVENPRNSVFAHVKQDDEHPGPVFAIGFVDKDELQPLRVSLRANQLDYMNLEFDLFALRIDHNRPWKTDFFSFEGGCAGKSLHHNLDDFTEEMKPFRCKVSGVFDVEKKEVAEFKFEFKLRDEEQLEVMRTGNQANMDEISGFLTKYVESHLKRNEPMSKRINRITEFTMTKTRDSEKPEVFGLMEYFFRPGENQIRILPVINMSAEIEDETIVMVQAKVDSKNNFQKMVLYFFEANYIENGTFTGMFMDPSVSTGGVRLRFRPVTGLVNDIGSIFSSIPVVGEVVDVVTGTVTAPVEIAGYFATELANAKVQAIEITKDKIRLYAGRRVIERDLSDLRQR